MDYAELIDWLRNGGCSDDPDCEHCPDSTTCELYIMNKAADAIKELTETIASLKKQVQRQSDMIAAKDRDLQRAANESKWIPVTERLPKIGEKVFVNAYGNDFLLARLTKQIENGYPVFECNGIFLEMAKPGRITNWMPIPEPPKEET